MSVGKIIGFTLLGLLWLWLARALIVSGGGFTLKNLFIIIASGIIIFVPLYKKYIRGNQN